MFKGAKKLIGVCCIGFGLGTILVLILPVKWWIIILGVTSIFVGLIWMN